MISCNLTTAFQKNRFFIFTIFLSNISDRIIWKPITNTCQSSADSRLLVKTGESTHWLNQTTYGSIQRDRGLRQLTPIFWLSSNGIFSEHQDWPRKVSELSLNLNNVYPQFFDLVLYDNVEILRSNIGVNYSYRNIPSLNWSSLV